MSARSLLSLPLPDFEIQGHGFPAWSACASTCSTLPKLPPALAEKGVRIRLAVSKYRKAHEVPKSTDDDKKKADKRKQFCPNCCCEQCKAKKQKVE